MGCASKQLKDFLDILAALDATCDATRKKGLLYQKSNIALLTANQTNNKMLSSFILLFPRLHITIAKMI